MAKIQVIAKPRVKIIFNLTFITDQIQGVCYSIGELLIFDLQTNISSVSELRKLMNEDYMSSSKQSCFVTPVCN